MKPSFTLFILCLFFCASMNGQGDTLYRSFIHQDSLRSYILYVPEAYDGSEDWPLVMNFHGFQNSAADQMVISKMNAVADTGHFMVVYPQGLLVENPFNGAIAPGWNIFGTLSDNDDVAFTSDLIDHITADYAVDLARVYATGWSMGASMSYDLACQLSDRIAAIGSVANQMSQLQISLCQTDRSVPVLQMHGTSDPIVPYNGAVFPTGLDSFLVASRTAAYWAEQNGCTVPPDTVQLLDLDTTDQSQVRVFSYDNCSPSTQVIFYEITGGGHTWSGGAPLPNFLGPVNRDINASSEIWNFFKRNPHPNPPGRVLEQSFVHDDSLRSYLLYVPNAYDGSEDWPLVINIHGYALDAAFQMTFGDMNSVADTAHFLVAYPQGMRMDMTLPGFPPQGLGFNVGADSIFTSPSNANDVNFIEQIIDSISTNYKVAADQIYATGFSNGGILSNILACELGDRIAAVAAVGGNLPVTWDCSPSRPLPILFIHGTEDAQVPYEEGIPNFLYSIPESLDFWTTNNNCAGEPVFTTLPDLDMTDNSTVEFLQWQACDAEVAHFKVIDGAHQWPGGNNLLPFLGNFNLDINASSEIWNFFNRHSLSTSTNTRQVSPEHLKVQVFPNPFSTELHISFELQETANVQLSIFNAQGKQVQELYNGRLNAGMQQFSWNTLDNQLPNGIYFYRLNINNQTVSRPIILTRNK